MRTSTIYTIGTALNRAQGTDVSVDVLVTGQWLRGHVTAVDGHGLVLHGDDDVLSVLRMDSISAVQVRQSSTFEQLPEPAAPSEQPAVRPMPAAGAAPDWARPDAAHAARSDEQPQWTGPVRHRTDPGAPYAFGPGPSATVVPSPRTMPRPTVGPIVAPSAVPDAGLHTMLRSCRTAPSPVAEAAAAG